MERDAQGCSLAIATVDVTRRGGSGLDDRLLAALGRGRACDLAGEVGQGIVASSHASVSLLYLALLFPLNRAEAARERSVREVRSA